MDFYPEYPADPEEEDWPARFITFDAVKGTPAFTRLGNQSETTHGQLQLCFNGRPERPLWRPNRPMREVHAIANKILRSFIVGIPARTWGPQVNAQNAAANGPYLYIVDLLNAFGSIDGERLARLFQSNHSLSPDLWGETAEDTLELLQRYFLSPDGGLYQGGPASPWLFEFYVRRLLDKSFESHPQLRNYSNGKFIPPTWAFINSVSYSRYVDDLVFASPNPIGQRKRQYIKQIIRQAGFAVNEQKTRGIVMRRQTVVLNGVALRRTSHGTRTFLPRAKLRLIEGLLHKAALGEEVSPAIIHGHMSQFRAANPNTHYNATEQRVWDAYRRLFPECQPSVFDDIYF